MDLFNIAVGDDNWCGDCREQYCVTSIGYKQYIINKAEILFAFQTISTIIAIVVQLFGNAEPQQIWQYYGTFWSALWYLFVVISAAKYAWWFKKSDWACYHDNNDDNDIGINNDTDTEFHAVKFSVN